MSRKLFFILFNTLVAFAFIQLLPAQLKIEIRFSLFSRFTNTIDDFDKTPTDFKNGALDFVHYKENYLKDVLSSHSIPPFYFQDTTKLVNRVKEIILTYSKNGGLGCGINSDDLIKNIKWLSEDNGHGCCSDHSQVFVALCLVNNIFPKEVHHSSHTFNEFFDPKLQKWIWVDTQFCLFAKDEQGNYMSLKEIYNAFQGDKAINWEFFGTPQHQFYTKEGLANFEELFSKQQFKLITMTTGNNVFEMDYYNKKYALVPREIAQFYFLATHKQPKYLFFDPKNTIKPYFDKILLALGIFMTCFIAINLCVIFPSLRYRLNGYLYKKRNSL